MSRVQGLIRLFLNTPLARSLRFRLIAIVLLASLPTIALLFFTASQQRDDALDQGKIEAENLARLAASEQTREMDRLQREMLLLSRLPEVRGDDSSYCTQFFMSLVADPDNAMYVDLRVLDRDGNVFCRSSLSNPLGQNENTDFINYAIDNQVFTVGRYRINPLNDRSILSFASPVRTEDGEFSRAIVATIDLGNQSSNLSRMTLPEGAMVSIVQDDGTLLFQQPPPEQPAIGESAFGTPVVDAAFGPEATPTGGSAITYLEGDGYLSAAAPIAVSGVHPEAGDAYVIVQLPEQEVVRRADDAFRDYLSKLGIAVAIAILAAWVSADLFMARDGETRKSIVAEYYHGYSSGATEHLDAIISPDFHDHSPADGQAKGLDGLKQGISAFRHAFPDGEVVPREMFADSDKVVARVSLTGTQIGSFQGIRPSGKRMIADGIEVFQFQHGVITEAWSIMGPMVEMDRLEAPEPRIAQQPERPNWFRRILGRGRRLFRPGRRS